MCPRLQATNLTRLPNSYLTTELNINELPFPLQIQFARFLVSSYTWSKELKSIGSYYLYSVPILYNSLLCTVSNLIL